MKRKISLKNHLFILILVIFGCIPKKQKISKFIDGQYVSIDNIITNSLSRQSHINLAEIKIERLFSLDSNSVKALFNNETMTSDTSKFMLTYDEYARYYLYDHVVLKDKFLFTIIHNDEIGYNYLYQFTVYRNNKRIYYVHLIGITGGDGGDYTNDSLIFNQKGDKLTVISNSISEDIGNSAYSTIQHDSLVRHFNFLLDKIIISTLHESSRKDTIVDRK